MAEARLGFVAAVKRCFAKFLVIEGRARRAEYWWFVLFTLSVALPLIALDVSLLGGDYLFGSADIWSLAMLPGILSAMVRRLHDQNRSGWYVLLLLVPILGALILLMWMAKPGDAGANRYGPDPLQEA